MIVSWNGQHRGEDFQAEIFFIPESVSAALYDPDLCIQALDEAERGLRVESAILGEPVPVPFDKAGELDERWGILTLMDTGT